MEGLKAAAAVGICLPLGWVLGYAANERIAKPAEVYTTQTTSFEETRAVMSRCLELEFSVLLVKSDTGHIVTCKLEAK